MKELITKKLQQIKTEHGITILYACESGSRAWGFPSPDSDYDVRFIYVRKIEDYLSINKMKDALDFPINGELDLGGWDLQKTLSQICKSNSVPFEWLQSPIVYYEKENFREELWQLCHSYFCPKHSTHHYLGIARGAMTDMENEEIAIKKLFYVLRPILSALWCLEKKNIPPMIIVPLLELMPLELSKKVLSLIEEKSRAKERFSITIDTDIKEWIDTTMRYCMEESSKLEKKYFDISMADKFFLNTLKQ